ncbi:uncharacterized protein LOC104583985 [Brachypodium distachyon]|uniref:uncharacterized protein LOC104583985 n=1 Tax=Brachypodium distachyon TaxID=15368 RepID=UPI00052FEE4D|nr:uncharacterized protein LOC104583985 [Brachypodium distachyon]|eukprot:XP_010236347.1 uncharacterized protein LOC104583985 [Brachypodium distachyon]
MDCFFRVRVLAVGSTVCMGGTALIIWSLVSQSRRPHSKGSIAVVSIILVMFCGPLFPWPTAPRRCLVSARRAPLRFLRGAGWLLCLPCRCARERLLAESDARAPPGAAGAQGRATTDDIPAAYKHPEGRANGRSARSALTRWRKGRW